MPAFSGLQLLAVGLTYAWTGVSLLTNPTAFLLRLSPLTALVEQQTGLKAYQGGDEGLALAGIALVLLAYYHVMAVYTLDEKFKRNSVSGRLFATLASYYACYSTPHGSSLIALFGIFNLVTGLVLGLSVGFGDGNAVDLELRQRWEERQKAAAGGARKEK
ncbi:hypothetical protein JCM6882_004132 [Rhodosporidiobolus microsporus]